MTTSTRPMRTARTRRLRALACFVAVLAAVTLGGGSASATIGDRFKFTNPYDYSELGLRIRDERRRHRVPPGPGARRQEPGRQRLRHRQLRIQGDVDRVG